MFFFFFSGKPHFALNNHINLSTLHVWGGGGVRVSNFNLKSAGYDAVVSHLSCQHN